MAPSAMPLTVTERRNSRKFKSKLSSVAVAAEAVAVLKCLVARPVAAEAVHCLEAPTTKA